MKNEEEIKNKIINGYRRGVCDENGKTMPRDKRGRSGKGSHFIAVQRPFLMTPDEVIDRMIRNKVISPKPLK